MYDHLNLIIIKIIITNNNLSILFLKWYGNEIINKFFIKMSLLRLNLVKRFISRFDDGLIPNIKKVTLNNNQKMKDKFEKLVGNREIIQVYHCTDSYEYLERTKNIFDNGFRIGPASNKGYGVYFASHSQYSAFWGGCNHVIVADVIVDKDFVSRHISEIYSTKNNWEYVVSTPELIFPRCLIEFELSTSNALRNKSWSNGICDNCREEKEKLDECFRRCDCKHFPTADKLDIITYATDLD